MKGWVILVVSGVSVLQGLTQDMSMTKQCSAIREICYQAASQFASLVDQSLHNSHGYQANGQWKFSHEQFSVSLPWPGAEQTLVEHATDDRDTLFTEYWQYIATFQTVATPSQGVPYFRQVLAQIDGCVLPLNDSITVKLQPVDPTELSGTMPDNLVDAFLFVIPSAVEGKPEVSVMIGLERLRRGYRPLLMVEVVTEDKRN